MYNSIDIDYSLAVAIQDTTFGYVICGGRTAGLTIAARLAGGTSNELPSSMQAAL